MRAVVQAAQDGDMRAADILLRRLWPERNGRPVTLPQLPPVHTAADLPATTEAILRATCNGELTPEEAEMLTRLLQTHFRALQLCELDARLRAIEERIESEP